MGEIPTESTKVPTTANVEIWGRWIVKAAANGSVAANMSGAGVNGAAPNNAAKREMPAFIH